MSAERRSRLEFLLSTLHKWKPVEIPLTIREERPVIMYVDAYFVEDNSLGEGHTSPPSKKYFGGLGALVIDDQGEYVPRIRLHHQGRLLGQLGAEKEPDLAGRAHHPALRGPHGSASTEGPEGDHFWRQSRGGLLYHQGQFPGVGSPIHHRDHPPQVR